MLEFLVVRPGMTEFDVGRRLKGRLDLPLCPLGLEQAADAAEEIFRAGSIVAIYTAPCQSSRQTAEQFARLGDVKPRICQELANLDLGLWTGLCLEDIRQRQPTVYRRWREDPENICPPGGEMLWQARQRLQDALTRIAKKHSHGRIVLVVPEPLASILGCHLRSELVSELWNAENNFGTFESIGHDSSSIAVRRP